MNRKLQVLMIGVLLLSCFAINIPFASADSWYDSDWFYRKSHVLSGITGGGPNWQIYINVFKGTGTDSGYNIYLNNLGQSDYDDLRFTDNDKVTLLDYWVETITATYATVWIEIKDSLAIGNSVTFYIYYGNSEATSASSGANTFLLFEQFDDDGLTGWTVFRVNDNDWLAPILDTTYYVSSPNAGEHYDDGSVTLSANSYVGLRSPSISWSIGYKIGMDVREYHLTTQTLAGKQYVMTGISYGGGSISFSNYDMYSSKGTWNLRQSGWPTTTHATGYVELNLYTQVLVTAGDGIVFSVRYDEVRVRYSTGSNPANGAYGPQTYHSETRIYYNALGSAYYSCSDGTPITLAVNGTVYYVGFYNTTIYALPLSNNTYVSMVINATDTVTSNPYLYYSREATEIWVNFATPSGGGGASGFYTLPSLFAFAIIGMLVFSGGIILFLKRRH